MAVIEQRRLGVIALFGALTLLTACEGLPYKPSAEEDIAFDARSQDGLVVMSLRSPEFMSHNCHMFWWPFDLETGRYRGTVQDAILVSDFPSPKDYKYEDGNPALQKVDGGYKVVIPKTYHVFALPPGTYALQSYTVNYVGGRATSSGLRATIDVNNTRPSGPVPAFEVRSGEAIYVGDFICRVLGMNVVRMEDSSVELEGSDLAGAQRAMQAYDNVHVELGHQPLTKVDAQSPR